MMPDRSDLPEAMRTDDMHSPFSLSPRQIEVLELAAEGLTVMGIARRLLITERTIRKHLRDARDRLNAQNTTQAVAIALATNLIEVRNLEEVMRMEPAELFLY